MSAKELILSNVQVISAQKRYMIYILIKQTFLGRCPKVSKMPLFHFLFVSMLSTNTKELSFPFCRKHLNFKHNNNNNSTTNSRKIPIFSSKYIRNTRWISGSKKCSESFIIFGYLVNYMKIDLIFSDVENWKCNRLGSDWLYNIIHREIWIN